MTGGPILLHAAQTYQPQTAPEESDQTFRAIVESVIEGILVVQDGKRVYYNPRWLELTGYSAEEYAKIPYPSLIHPADVGVIVHADDQIVYGQIPNAEYELRLVTRSGEIRWLAVHASRLLWDNRPAVISVHADITERKLAEQKLRDQATLLEKISDAVITTDMGFIIQSWNGAAQTTYGFGAAEALGQRLGLLIPTAYRDAITRDAAAEHLRAHGSWQGEVRQKHKDGSDLDILSSVNIVRDADGQPTGIVAINRDISERVRAEERVQQSEALYSSVISALSEGLVVHDTSDKIVMANQSAADILGLSLDQLLGKDSYDPRWQSLREDGTAFRPEDHPTMITLRTGKGVDNTIMKVHTGDEKYSVISINSRPVLNQAGEMTSVVATFSDITRQRQAEESLLASEEKLRAIYAAIPVPTYTWQADGDDFVLTDSNDAGRRVSNGRIMELIGIKASVMYRDRPDIVDDIARCYREKKTIQREMEYVLRTTGKIDFLDVKYAYVPPDQVLVHTEDISERKRIEAERENLNKELEERVRQRTEELRETSERLLLATSVAQIGIWDWDVQQDIVVWDETVCALFGIRPTDFDGNNGAFEALLHPDDVAAVDQAVRTALQGATRYENEFRVITPSGDVRSLRSVASIHYDEHQQAVRMIGVNWDVTERNRILTELQTFNETMVDREVRIIELKEEINALAEALGRETPYPPIWANNGNDSAGGLWPMEGGGHG